MTSYRYHMDVVDSNLLLQMLKLKTETYMNGMPITKYEEIYLNHDCTEIHLKTKTGGCNRKCNNYGNRKSHSIQCYCGGCMQTYLLPTHPYYLCDDDWDMDNLYAITRFSIPYQYGRALSYLLISEECEWYQDAVSWKYTSMKYMV